MKTTFKTTIAAALLAGTSLAVVGVAFAQDATPAPQDSAATPAPVAKPPMPHMGKGENGPRMGFDFVAVDTNGDGQITLEEIEAKRQADAAALDSDGNGLISAEELVAQEMAQAQSRIEARVAKRIEMFDADGDGSLSAAELIERPTAAAGMFARIDANGDGAVTQEELAQARQMRMEHDGRKGGKMERHGDHDRKGKGDRDGGRKDGGRKGDHARPVMPENAPDTSEAN
ncbi:hypothetical protein BFP70_11015 [Thioclava sp. SK-1]|uniref:EF-hand domain-containing protein n=1 Tax=Thioclava sp. SK-1 TaxID=1889770 RepID=UPI0008250024|nr:hypothetical protein [Thioclava sp. SK-1]OCX64558.1 hypothetical protein BFP70_11015 [Thioclava sp. SK-1]